MKTLNGYEVVDAKAREDIEALKNAEVDLTGYATEAYVDTAIGNIPKVDLSQHALKSELPTKISQLQNDSKFITREEVPETDLSAYAKKSEIPDVSDFITSIPDEYITENELKAKGFTTEAQVDNKVAANRVWVNSQKFATESYVNDAIANSTAPGGVNCNVPLISYSEVDISNTSPGIYGINSSQWTLQKILCSELNATVNFQWWVSNGMLLIRDKNVIAWGQDNADIIFYVINMENYQDQEVTVAPSARLKADGWEGVATQQFVLEAIASLGTTSADGKSVLTLIEGNQLTTAEQAKLADLWERAWNGENVLSQNEIVIIGNVSDPSQQKSNYLVTNFAAYLNDYGEKCVMISGTFTISHSRGLSDFGIFAEAVKVVEADGSLPTYTKVELSLTSYYAINVNRIQMLEAKAAACEYSISEIKQHLGIS